MIGARSNDENVSDGLQRMAQQFPRQTAIYFLGEKWTCSQLLNQVDRFASALYGLGVRDNDKVMIYMQNCPQWLIAYFAVLKIGAVVVPTSPIYTPYEIAYQLNDSGAETIVCQDTNYGYVREVFPDTPLKRVVISNIADLLPRWKRIIGRAVDCIPFGNVEKGEGIYFFRNLLKSASPDPPKVKIDPGEHLAHILYTGGTTADPKGVAGTHAFLLQNIVETAGIIEGHVVQGQERLIMINPLFHILGQMACMGMGLYATIPAIIMPVPNIDAILNTIDKYKVTLMMGSPALYRMMLENARLPSYDLSSLKFCWSGGDLLPAEVFHRFRKLTGRPIYQLYGSTEAGTLAQSALDKEPTSDCMGFTVASKAYRIADPETLAPVSPGEPGELMISCGLILDYWNKPEETARTFVQIDGKRWYRTSDFVRMDPDGLIYYVERSADIIKHKAFRVSASEIESILKGHGAVIEACVIGVPDEKVGERIKAIVVLKEGVRGVDGSELIRHCREKIAAYKVPQYIEFRDMLPKSKVGKLLRREIRAEERRRSEKQSA
ncbi:MAG: AMP-binding protein [Desulfobacterales bacterium]|nr:AMP-binding protein [Desulfobacterales bacterium]